MWIDSSFYLLEKVSGSLELYFELLCHRLKIRDVVSDETVGMAVDCGFQDHLVVGIAQLRSPLEVDLNRLDDLREISHKKIDLPRYETVPHALFGSTKHVLILQKQSRGREHDKVSSVRKLKQLKACT